MSEQPLDLTSTEVTRRLLREPRAWRERAVESLHVGSAQFIRRERSLQCRPLYPLVADLLAGSSAPSSRAFVVLPLAVLPKQPLLEFGVDGPHGSARLLRRPDIAAREAALIASYASDAGLDLPSGLEVLLPRLLGFTEGTWEAVPADTPRGVDRVAAYLERGLTTPASSHQRDRLRKASATSTGVLDAYADGSHRHVSAPEQPFLVVPELVEDGYVPDAEAALLLVEQYAAFLHETARLATSRQSNEMHAFYVWEVDVDFRVVLSARLDVLRRVVIANVLVGLVVLLLAAALVLRPPTTAGELAIVAGPTAAVAGLLLLREPSTLASRLRSRYSAGVVACVLALIAIAVWRFTTLPDLP